MEKMQKFCSWDFLLKFICCSVTVFPGIGYLLGQNGMISFDGRPLVFKAGCGYLLAADFLHQQFLITGIIDPASDPVSPQMKLKIEFRGDEVELVKDRQSSDAKVML